MRRPSLAAALLLSCAFLFPSPARPGQDPAAELARLRSRQDQFAPVDITADLSGLSQEDRAALAKILQAAQALDALYLRQVWAGNEALLLSLQDDPSALGRARLRFFLTHKGPWDRQDGNRPFIPEAPLKPAGADFYPADATKPEVEGWLASLAPADKAEASGFFTVIRRAPGGKLRSVPYSMQYQNELSRAAALLKEAAALTGQPTLKAYLDKRADAFLSNDYYASDVAWMELDSSIEPVLGPYETYEDDWFSNKAAFEAFIALRDEAETAKLQRFAGELQWLEDNLPLAAALRNPKLGALAPIRVVNQLYSAGDAAHGVATAAFNLPNDERVTKEKGSKRVMLKNVQEAKFKMVLMPLARLAIAPADLGKVSFDAFFTHILMHELMHGLGPHETKGATVRQALQEFGGALEEAKADISGLWALQKLVDKGVLDRELERTMYVTFFASAFRTLRFGTAEAHGKGMALQLNYLLDHGAAAAAPDGAFAVDAAKFRRAVEGLTRELMEIQARGDYAGAKALFKTLGVVRPEVRRVLERAEGIPVDIAPRHVTAESVLGR